MISLDEEMEDGNTSIIETIPSSINIEEEIINGDCSDNLQNYLNTLSKKQKSLAELFMQGYTIENAKEEMNLSRKEMENMLKFMRSYERRMLLNESGVISKGEEKHMKNQVTMEKSKATKMDVNALVKKMNNKTINFDHPLQRYAGQWSNKMKSDLISDIIQGNPIPALIFAEQIINGTAITFDLDGKQRCTTVKEFKEDIFHGKGLLFYINGNKTIGLWKNNKRNGNEFLFSKEGDIYHHIYENNTLMQERKCGAYNVQKDFKDCNN